MFVNHRLEYSLCEFFIFHVEVYLKTDLFLVALYSKARVLISHSICDFSALIRGEFYSKAVSRCTMLPVDNVVVAIATMHDPTAMGLVRVLQVVVIVVESIGRAILKEETSLSLSKT